MNPVLSIPLALLVSFLPGWLFLYLLPLRERLSAAERVAMAVAFSAAQVFVGGLLLVHLRRFTAESVVGLQTFILCALVIAITVAWWRSPWRRPRRPHWSIVRHSVRRSVPTVVVWLAVAAPYVYSMSRGLRINPSAWRYALDTEHLMEAGGIPESSLQWGVERPFAISKLGSSVWIGWIRSVGGMDEFDSLQYVAVVFLFFALAGAWALLRRHFQPWGAAGAVVLLFTNFLLWPLPLDKLSRLTTEGAGVALGVVAIFVLATADRLRSSRLRWFAAGLLVAVGITHLISFVLVSMAVGILVLFSFVSQAEQRWRRLGRDVAMLAVLPAAIVFSGVLVGGGSEISGGLAGEDSYVLIEGSGDPTFALKEVKRGRSIEGSFEPDLADPSRYARSYFAKSLGGPVADWAAGNAVAVSGVIALLFLVSILLVRERRVVTAVLAVAGAAPFGLALLFYFRYDLWIFLEHPIRREFPYTMLPVLLLLLALAGAATVRGRLLRYRVAAVPILVVVLLASYGATWAGHGTWSLRPLDEDEISVLEWMEGNLPPRSRILTNVRTTAIFEMYADQISVTEGGVPYLFPGLLDEVLVILDEGQRFFAAPDPRLLSEWKIDYVVRTVSRSDTFAGQVYARTREGVLASQPFLTEVARFGENVVFEVADLEPFLVAGHLVEDLGLDYITSLGVGGGSLGGDRVVVVSGIRGGLLVLEALPAGALFAHLGLDPAGIDRLGAFDPSVAVAPPVPIRVAAAASAESYPEGNDRVYLTLQRPHLGGIAVAAAAAHDEAPILLLTAGGVPRATRAELVRLAPRTMVVVGDEGATPEAVVAELREIVPDAEVSRVEGPERFSAAAALSASTFPAGVETVFVTQGAKVPERWIAAQFASATGAPLLLVKTNRIPSSVRDELGRLQPERIVVVGDVEVVADSVLGALGEYAPRVERIGGEGPEATSAALSALVFPGRAETVYVAVGQDWGLSLAASVAARNRPGPALLVYGESVPPAVAAELRRLAPSRIVIVGSTEAVSPRLLTELVELTW